MKEDELHAHIVQWLDLALPAGSIVHHSPNEGRRHVSYKLKMRRMGMKPGWPDLEVFVPQHGWKDPLQPGPIMLEVKRPKGGRMSDAQKDIHERLRDAGAYCLVVKRIAQVEALFAALVKLRNDAQRDVIRRICEQTGG